MIHCRAKAVLETWVCFSGRQEETWALITLVSSCVLGPDRIFFFSLFLADLRYNLIEAEDCSCEFCCVHPPHSPGPSMPKVAHDAQLGKQRSPAAVSLVVMPVVETLIFQESLWKCRLLTELMSSFQLPIDHWKESQFWLCVCQLWVYLLLGCTLCDTELFQCKS